MAIDTEEGSEDVVVRQLKKLREGAGLSRDRLADSGGVMSALGTSDPEEAFTQLLAILGQMDQQPAEVLRLDFALDLDRQLGRVPTAREQRWLGDRRGSYGRIIGRDSKTLARWSDAAILELRSRLLNDTYTGDLFVAAAVRDNRIIGITLIQEDESATAEGAEPKRRKSLGLSNPTAEPSLPCLLYAFPRDWQPRNLILIVSFESEPRPTAVFAIHADTFLDVSFAANRYPIDLKDGMATCRFPQPPRTNIYGVWWRWD